MAISINGTTGIAGVDGSAGTPALQGSDTNTGIAFGSDVILGSTGGTERFRCDSSGRLLVGTTTARSNYFNTTFTPQIQFETTDPVFSLTRTSNTTDPGYFVLAKTRGTGNVVVQNGDNLGIVSFQGNDGSEFVQAAEIAAQVDGTPGANDMPGRLVFSTTADGASSPTEAVRVDSSQRVLIGSASAGNVSAKGLRVATASSSSSDYSLEIVSGAADTHLLLRNDGYFRSPIIYTRTSGGSANVFVDSSGYVYRSTSSQRYKRDIQPANYTLEQIDALNPVTYKSSIADPDGNESNRVFGGLIAEDVDAAGLQEFVDYDEQGRPDALQYGHMISVAIKGLQEAHTRIKELEAKVAALESA